jgi:hypothetical protein
MTRQYRHQILTATHAHAKRPPRDSGFVQVGIAPGIDSEASVAGWTVLCAFAVPDRVLDAEQRLSPSGALSVRNLPEGASGPICVHSRSMYQSFEWRDSVTTLFRNPRRMHAVKCTSSGLRLPLVVLPPF